MKFLFETGDVLTQEKWFAEQSVENPRTDILRIHPEFMQNNRLVLDKKFVPLGTVQFCANYMNHMNVGTNTTPLDYPYALRKYLGREVRFDYANTARLTDYIKPRVTKEFTCAPRVEVEKIITLTSEKMVWISEPISIGQEYRLYVLNKEVVGYSRYDDLDEEDILPDWDLVENMIRDFFDSPVSYTLDVGISDGKTVLVEVNDMWATGFYQWGTMTGEMYLKCLQERWFEIIGYR